MKNPKIKIIRYVRPSPTASGVDEYPTLGVLYIDDRFFCYTLEPSWKNNLVDSCIPDGKYKLIHYNSGSFGRCLIVPFVKRRSGILIHKGNTSSDTTGCILVGGSIGFLDGSFAVLGSAIAFMSLLERLQPFNSMKLEIKSICTKWEGVL